MNFYQAQNQARKQSKLLLALFALALGFLVFVTNICVALFVLYSDPEYALDHRHDLALGASHVGDWLQQLWFALGWQKALWTTLLVCGMIFIAMAFKWSSLRQGGSVVAQSLGGKLVQPSSSEPLEKRLLNVVEEIALASGVPVPQVYVLDNEQGINAFAAGLSPEDAVIGVTRGALLSFNREQLQGVIAHEFSHILNGDMRLNMQLIAVLHGMLMIAESGYFFMRMGSSGRGRRHGFSMGSSYRNRDSRLTGVLFLFGLSLWLIGLIGQFLGALIKAAVSRQREFLADASAVQFTRNANGIGEALSIIGGADFQSRLEHHGAHELSHLFFSNANSLESGQLLFHPSRWPWFATHPPLAQRIERILPRWNKQYIRLDPAIYSGQHYTDPEPAYPSFAEIQAKSSLVSGQEDALTKTGQNHHEVIQFAPVYEAKDVSDSKGDGTAKHADYVFTSISEQMHHSYDAALFAMAIFLSEDTLIREQQAKLIAQKHPQKAEFRLKQLYAMNTCLNVLNAKQMLLLIDLCLPSLRLMSAEQYQSEKALWIGLIKMDGKVELIEWMLFQLLTQSLDLHFGQKQPVLPTYKRIDQLSSAFEVVLSRMVHFGFQGVPEEQLDQSDKRLAFIRALDAAGLKKLTLLSLEQCEGSVFSKAVFSLQKAYPLIKPRILKALMVAVCFDDHINDEERYLMSLIASVMDCPLMDLDEMLAANMDKM